MTLTRLSRLDQVAITLLNCGVRGFVALTTIYPSLHQLPPIYVEVIVVEIVIVEIKEYSHCFYRRRAEVYSVFNE